MKWLDTMRRAMTAKQAFVFFDIDGVNFMWVSSREVEEGLQGFSLVLAF